MPTRFDLSLRGAQRRGNLDEAEHTSANRRCYGEGIANPRIEHGVAMTEGGAREGERGVNRAPLRRPGYTLLGRCTFMSSINPLMS